MTLAFNTGSGCNGTGTAKTITIGQTHAANVMVLVGVSYEGTTSPSGVTIGQGSATSLSKISYSTNVTCELFYLFRTAAATENIIVTFAANTRAAAVGAAYTGAKNISAFEGTLTANGTGASPCTGSKAILSGTDGRLVIGVAAFGTTGNANATFSIAPANSENERAEAELAGATAKVPFGCQIEDLADAGAGRTQSAAGTISTGTPCWGYIVTSLLPPSTVTKTYAADSRLLKHATSALTIDGYLKKLNVPKILSVDELLKKLSITKNLDADSRLLKGFPKTLSVDDYLKKLSISTPLSVDEFLKTLSIPKALSADTLFLKEFSAGLSVDVILISDDPTYHATLHGTITDIGGIDVDERGFEWDVDSEAPYDQSWTETATYGTGAFSHQIAGLAAGTWYFRAKAHNNAGWSYGEEQSFTTTTIVTKTYTLDALVQKKNLTKTATFDQFIRKAITKNLPVDSLLRKTVTAAETVDIQIQKILLKQLSEDVRLSKNNILNELPVDSILKKAIATSTTIDMQLEKSQSKQYDLDLRLLLEIAQELSATMLLKSLDKSKSYTVDRILKKVDAAVDLGVTLLVQKLVSKDMSVDVMSLKSVASQLLTDLVVKKLNSAVSYTVDMIVGGGGLNFLDVEILLQKTESLSSNFDLILVNRHLQSLSIDTIVKGTNSILLAVDSLFKKGLMASYVTDLLLQKATSKQYTIDLRAMLELIKALSVSILVKLLDQTETYTLDLLLRKVSLAANLSATILVQKLVSKGISVNTLLAKAAAEQLLVDLLIQKLNKSVSYQVSTIMLALDVPKSFNVNTYLKKLKIPLSINLDLMLVKRLLSTLDLDVRLTAAVQRLLVADVLVFYPTLLKDYGIDVIVSIGGPFGISSFTIGKRKLEFDVKPGKLDLTID